MKESARRRARHVTIFLDVDGVLNSFPVKGKRFQKEGRRKVHAWNFVLHYRPKIVKMLEQIVDKRDADIIWLTTWSALCRTEIEPKLEFTRSYPIIEMPDDTFNRYAGDHTRWWKAVAVKKWLADNPGRRAVWIDDDLAFPETFAYFRNTYRDRILLIAPKFETGLDEHHIKAIQEFSYPRPDDSAPAEAGDFVVAPTAGTARDGAGRVPGSPNSVVDIPSAEVATPSSSPSPQRVTGGSSPWRPSPCAGAREAKRAGSSPWRPPGFSGGIRIGSKVAGPDPDTPAGKPRKKKYKRKPQNTDDSTEHAGSGVHPTTQPG